MLRERTTRHIDRVKERTRTLWHTLPADTRDFAVPLALILVALMGVCGLSGLGAAWFGTPAAAPTPVRGVSAATSTPACRPLPTTAGLAASAGIRVNGAAVVCGRMEEALPLRCSPGMRQQEVGQVAEGMRVTILEGPVGLDGFRWWRIVAAGGTEGWTPDNWLCAAP